MWRTGQTALWARVEPPTSLDDSPELRASVTLFDEQGEPVAQVQGLRLRRAQAQKPTDRHRFCVQWKGTKAPEASGLSGRWGLWAPQGCPWASGLQSHLQAAGAEPVWVNDVEQTNGLSGLLCVWDDEGEPHEGAHRLSALGLGQLQSLLTKPSSLKVVWLTKGAVSISAEDGAPGLCASPLWGLGRTAHNEHPELDLRLLDVGEAEDLQCVAAALSLKEEQEVAVRAGSLYIPRLVRAAAPPSQEAALLRTDGAVLITGGLGSLGREVARWLVQEQGVREVILSSRRGADAPGASEAVAELEELGAKATVMVCDVSDGDAVHELLSTLTAQGPLRGIVHAAGVLDDGILSTLEAEQLERVLGPKVDGAWHLHRLSEGQDLDLFVLFSSVAGIWGNPGQGNYAAANAFMDTLAQHRRAHGLKAVSVAWGPWAQGGMVGALSEADQQRIEQRGLRALSAEQGTALLGAALRASEALSVAVAFNTARLQEQHALLPGIFRGLLPRSAKKRAEESAFRKHLLGLPEAERQPAVLELIRTEAAYVLGVPLLDVDPEQPLHELGLDSLRALELKNRLCTRLEVKLPATTALDYPTPEALALFLLQQAELAQAPLEVAVSTPTEEPIAIVSTACRYPGGVTTPEELWSVLLNGVDATSKVPEQRWDADALFDPDPETLGTSYCRRGGFVQDVDQFDAAFFGISAREAKSLDPQQRLLLEVSWEALERAGLPPERFERSRTGVFVGLMSHDYGLLFGSDFFSPSMVMWARVPSAVQLRVGCRMCWVLKDRA